MIGNKDITINIFNEAVTLSNEMYEHIKYAFVFLPCFHLHYCKYYLLIQRYIITLEYT